MSPRALFYLALTALVVVIILALVGAIPNRLPG